MKYNLFFERANKDLVLIRESVDPETEAKILFKYIHNAVQEMNPNYQIHYSRYWVEEDGTWTIDVGSWSEFFKLIPIKQEEKE